MEAKIIKYLEAHDVRVVRTEGVRALCATPAIQIQSDGSVAVEFTALDWVALTMRDARNYLGY